MSAIGISKPIIGSLMGLQTSHYHHHENMTQTPTSHQESGVPHLQVLGEEIAADATVICEYLRRNGLPQPSHQADGAPSVLPLTSPSAVQQARQRLLAASLEIFHLASGPSELLPHLATSVRRKSFILC